MSTGVKRICLFTKRALAKALSEAGLVPAGISHSGEVCSNEQSKKLTLLQCGSTDQQCSGEIQKKTGQKKHLEAKQLANFLWNNRLTAGLQLLRSWMKPERLQRE